MVAVQPLDHTCGNDAQMVNAKYELPAVGPSQTHVVVSNYMLSTHSVKLYITYPDLNHVIQRVTEVMKYSQTHLNV